MTDAPFIRFATNTDKVVEAVAWLANKKPGLDIFHVCKVLFLADREHLRRYSRPILGDRYIAMEDGPVPSCAYYVAQLDGRHLDGDTIENARSAINYDASGRYPRIYPQRPANEELFSRTDLAVLEDAAAKYGEMPFKELWGIVHDDAAYQAAWSESDPNENMNYELLLDPSDPYHNEVLADLRETATQIAF
jgi:uncharacterized phage-associated protein